MPGTQGTAPIFVNVPKVYSSNTITAANVSKDLSTGTIPPPVFQANTTNGSFLDHIRAKPLGGQIASVARVFWNNGQATTTAINNAMITEISLPAITGTETAAQIDIVIPVKEALPPSANVYVLLGTAVANGWVFTGWGGDY